MLIDILIIVFAISALYRGRELGFVRQFFSAAGFFGGLFLGALLEPHTITLVESESRSFVAVATTLGMAFIFLLIGEYVGIRLKQRLLVRRLNKYDGSLGSGLNVISLLLSTWLLAAVIGALPLPGVQTELAQSRIITGLNNTLPPAPTVLANLGKLIDPNGFPQVFIGGEPSPGRVDLPSLGELAPAVQAAQASVVKIEGRGCGGIVDGSGFVARNGFVGTNAHVVAGISNPYVIDTNGRHRATVVWFDPKLDFAVLRVSDLAGAPLRITPNTVPDGTPAAVIGYPGGGGLTADPAAVIDKITARGRDIYGQGVTVRDVYEIKGKVIPGNSGGPIIGKDGAVIGVVFAQSTTYDSVGYTLTTPKVISAINQAIAANQARGTGQCAED